MFGKAITTACVLAAITMGGLAANKSLTAKTAGGCCSENAACCQGGGSPCCDGGNTDCCYPGAPCCEAGMACCPK